MSKSRTIERQSGKRQRVPFGGHRTKLQLSEADMKAFEDSGYVPRWFNDIDGRIQRAEAGGYVFADPDEARSIGAFDVTGGGDLNGRVSKIVSRGGGTPIIGILMKIKKEFYIEDQVTKEGRNKMVDDSINAGRPGGNTVENQYVPEGHVNQV